jgi:hypothetical protein
MSKRRIIQITTIPVPNVITTQCFGFLYALCEDGTLWIKDIGTNDSGWRREENIPLDKEVE